MHLDHVCAVAEAATPIVASIEKHAATAIIDRDTGTMECSRGATQRSVYFNSDDDVNKKHRA